MEVVALVTVVVTATVAVAVALVISKNTSNFMGKDFFSCKIQSFLKFQLVLEGYKIQILLVLSLHR